MTITSSFLLFTLFLLSFAPLRLVAQDSEPMASSPTDSVYIKVGEARVKKSLLALTPVKTLGASSAKELKDVAAKVYSTLYADLAISGLFKLINQEAFLENPNETGLRPFPEDRKGFKFSNWSSLQTDFLVNSSVNLSGEEMTLTGYLYHVPTQKTVAVTDFRGKKSSAEKLAHAFAADILEKLTATKGMFLSQIVYSRTTSKPGVKEVFVSDWNSKNERQITFNEHLSISPSWSFDGTKIAYTYYTRRKSGKRDADLYIYDLTTGKRTLVSARPGTESGSMWLPDGLHLLLTYSKSSYPDIYKIKTSGEIVKQLTNGPRGAMNVEPAIPKDGSKIVFSSDRSGQPHIFMMDADGSNVVAKTKSPLGRYNSTPAFSPDGSKIVFASYAGDHFDLYLMDTDGKRFVKLTEGSADKNGLGRTFTSEDPTFSPDGRHIMFVSNKSADRKRQLYITNLDGTEEHRITNDQWDYFKPKWSWHH